MSNNSSTVGCSSYERIHDFIVKRKLALAGSMLTNEQQPIEVYASADHSEVLTYSAVRNKNVTGIWTEAMAKRGSHYVQDPANSNLFAVIGELKADPVSRVSAMSMRVRENILSELIELFGNGDYVSIATASAKGSSSMHLVGKFEDNYQLSYLTSLRVIGSVSNIRTMASLQALTMLRDYTLAVAEQMGSSQSALFKTLNNVSLISTVSNLDNFNPDCKDVFSQMSVAEIVEKSLAS